MAAAIIVAVIVSVISPMMLTLMQGRQRRAEKVEDWRRQDLVADRVARAAEVLEERTSGTDAKLDQLHEQGVEIHALVNSNMTSAMRAELDAIERELLVLEELTAMKKAAGHPVEPRTHDAIEVARARIAELGASLQDRMSQDVHATAPTITG